MVRIIFFITPSAYSHKKGKTSVKHYCYVCNKKNKNQCNKKREDKNTLEQYVTERVHRFLSNPKNTEIAAVDTIRYYNERTGDDGLKSIEARISHTERETEQLTESFIAAKNDMLRARIEKKMDELEIYLKDLYAYKTQILHERGLKITPEQIIDFIATLIKGDPADKEYQKKIIDNLVYKIFIHDDHIIVLFNLNGDNHSENITLSDTTSATKHITNSSTPKKRAQTPLKVFRLNRSWCG